MHEKYIICYSKFKHCNFVVRRKQFCKCAYMWSAMQLTLWPYQSKWMRIHVQLKNWIIQTFISVYALFIFMKLHLTQNLYIYKINMLWQTTDSTIVHKRALLKGPILYISLSFLLSLTHSLSASCIVSSKHLPV